MPITDQNNQLALLMHVLQAAKAQQNIGQQAQQFLGNPGGSALGSLMGGQPNTPGMTQLSPTAGLAAPSQTPAPPTLGIGRGMPMQMPPLQSANPDPQGTQEKPPTDPFL